MTWTSPKVMGVLNVTPDSFSDGGQFLQLSDALAQANLLLAQGADIIDIGGESTRPGAARVPADQEQQRVLPVIRAIRADRKFDDLQLSIDTMNSSTAREAVLAGANIINDVSGGLADPNMFRVAAETGAQIVISHWRGHSTSMDDLANYEDVARDVAAEISEQISIARANSVSPEKIIVDPGLGFAKNLTQNWELVARLNLIQDLGYPVLVGASRKRFIAGVLSEDLGSVSTERRDLATAVLTALLLQRKLWGVRVHNVEATRDAIRVVAALRESDQS